MDCHAQPAVVGTARAGLALAGLVLALASGCAETGQQLAATMATLAGEKPAPPVSRVVAVWLPQVVAGVDPAHAGAPMYGLAGRVFLWPADLKENLTADGRLVVELYAVLPDQPQAGPVKLETWELKKDVLNSINRRTDGVGNGYSLSLPWPSYRPDIAQVQMRVRYEPERGLPVMAQDTVALNGGPVAPPVFSSRTETGNRQPVAAAPPPGAPPMAGMPLRGAAQPAAGALPPGGSQPVNVTQVPGAVPPAGAAPSQTVAAPPQGGQSAPACVVQPAGAMPPPAAPPYQTAPQQYGDQPQAPAQGSYQMPPPTGGVQR